MHHALDQLVHNFDGVRQRMYSSIAFTTFVQPRSCTVCVGAPRLGARAYLLNGAPTSRTLYCYLVPATSASIIRWMFGLSMIDGVSAPWLPTAQASLAYMIVANSYVSNAQMSGPFLMHANNMA